MTAQMHYLESALVAEREESTSPGADRGGRTMPWDAVRALLDMGVPAGFLGQLTGAGDLAVAGVDLRASGTFEFGGPTRRLIMAVREYGEVVDLLALSSTCEDEWALLRGTGEFLGRDALDDAVMAERRELRLWPTPMAWLRAGGSGICVLDWTKTALGALRGLRSHQTIVVDPGARAKLEGMLAFGGLPLVAEDRRNLRRVA